MRRWWSAVLVSVAPLVVLSHEEAEQLLFDDRGVTERGGGLRGRELAQDWPVTMASHHSCSGMETYWDSCPDNPPCATCTPIACQFSIWSVWSSGHKDCRGLCRRTRSVAVHANECGRPCEGDTMETKSCPDDICEHSRNCELGAWRSWSACDSILDQTGRSRMVTQHAKNEGKACVARLAESKPCGFRNHTDCVMGDWNAWTDCSATCGDGHRVRTRTIKTPPVGVGHSCDERLWEESKCSRNEKCPQENCALASWGLWSGCDAVDTLQETRNRHLASIATGDGLACNDTLEEVRPCPSKKADCLITEWSAWSTCDADCDGGQKIRMRSISRPAKGGGTCKGGTMSEVTPCNEGSCISEGPQSCQLAQWSRWSACSNTCGKGYQERDRAVLSMASPAFKGCGSNIEASLLKESRECSSGVCAVVDCKWGEWSVWDACDATCGGGMQRRFRDIVTAPSNGGVGCEAHSLAEKQACQEQKCETCIDGKWSDWAAWSTCSESCGSAFKSRQRFQKQAPNICGQPADGPTTQYVPCEKVECPSNDCELSEWDRWTDCSSSCSGLRERKRDVKHHARGSGKSCVNVALREMSPCFTGTQQMREQLCIGFRAPVDCEWSSWSSWSTCSQAADVAKQCGQGQKSRQRNIVNPLVNGGAVCKGRESETAECNLYCAPTGCENCGFAPWSAWSSCKTGGGWPHRDGMSERSRTQMSMANHCGKACPVGAALKETRPCTAKTVELTTCDWSVWSLWSTCPEKCNSDRARRRNLTSVTVAAGEAATVSRAKLIDTVFDGNCTMKPQVEKTTSCKRCPKPVCMPYDLGMHGWTEWKADGTICSRERKRAQAKNKCGSYVGLGSTGEVKSCDPMSNWTACHLLNWHIWNKTCVKLHDQPYRHRSFTSNFPNQCRGITENDGLTAGDLVQVASCVDAFRPDMDCVPQDWSGWSACSTPKDPCTGTQQRTRNVTYAQGDGALCGNSPNTEKTVQAKECDQCRHNQVCKFANWSVPKVTVYKNSKYVYRVTERDIDMPVGSDIRTPCVGPMKEFKSQQPLPQQDCTRFAWTEWTACDKYCHGGYQRRHRVGLHATPGGKPCPTEDTMEVRACNDRVMCAGDPIPPIPANCDFAQWGTWSTCSATCGYGRETRTRIIAIARKWAPFDQTIGCEGHTDQTKICGGSPCTPVLGCFVPDWTPWSACSAPCGGGHMSRKRNITQFPQGGGPRCANASISEEVTPCNRHKCPAKCVKVDAVWAEWTASPCSSSCSGGLQMRKRTLSVNANECGAEAPGLSEDVVSCNGDVPCSQNVSCTFKTWTAWTHCEAPSSDDPCEGLKKRTRGMNPKIGHGSLCQGSLHEAISCLPNASAASCAPKPIPLDCELGHWSKWSKCNVDCGGGQIKRSRFRIVGDPQGKPCRGAMLEVKPCNTQECKGTRDCVYSQWTHWGACQTCGGQRGRQRHILSYAANGGKPCDERTLEETDNCPRDCASLLCAWADWRSWSQCSTDCGYGKRSRTRILSMVQAPVSARLFDASLMDDSALEDRVQELYRRSKSSEANRTGELLLAFGLGMTALLAFAAISNSRSCKFRRTAMSRVTTREMSLSHEGLSAPCSPSTPGHEEVRILDIDDGELPVAALLHSSIRGSSTRLRDDDGYRQLS